MDIKLNPNVGQLLAGILLVLAVLVAIFGVNIPYQDAFLYILALIAGAFLIIGR